MTTGDKILLFLAALVAAPMAFVIIVLIGLALTLAAALLVALLLPVLPLVAKSELAKAAGVKI